MRTTPTNVKAIIETDDVSIPDLTPFIEAAHSIVEEVCVPLAYTEQRLELIERWLSAHFYAVRDNRVASEQAGPVRQAFQYNLGLNLAVTMYGQQAMLLDTKGGLAALNKDTEEGRRKMDVGVFYLGTQKGKNLK